MTDLFVLCRQEKIKQMAREASKTDLGAYFLLDYLLIKEGWGDNIDMCKDAVAELGDILND